MGANLAQQNRSMRVNPAAVLQLEKQGWAGGILRLQGIKEAVPLSREAMRLAARAMAEE